MRPFFFAVGFAVGLTLSINIAFAWTGPTGSPPSNNVSTPINVSAASQVKNGTIGVNGLAVFGDTLLGGSANSNAYLNFGATAGTSGYGIWDNGGTLEFKNSGGSWASLQSVVCGLTSCSGGSVTGPYLPTYSSWESQGTGSGGAAIYNDNGSYQSLMIVGNNSAGGNREVHLWDDLTVNNNLAVDNNLNVYGNEYVTGNSYVGSRGMWMSETARDDGAQFDNWGNDVCPSGSVMVGNNVYYFGYEGSVSSIYAICQWIN